MSFLRRWMRSKAAWILLCFACFHLVIIYQQTENPYNIKSFVNNQQFVQFVYNGLDQVNGRITKNATDNFGADLEDQDGSSSTSSPTMSLERTRPSVKPAKVLTINNNLSQKFFWKNVSPSWNKNSKVQKSGMKIKTEHEQNSKISSWGWQAWKNWFFV